MEKRLILAIVLSFVVLVGFQLLFNKPQPQAPAGEAMTEIEMPRTPVEPSRRPERAAEIPAGEAPPAETGPPAGAAEEREVTVDTPLYTAVWSNRGGVLRSWRLKNHRDAQGEALDLVPAAAGELGLFPFRLQTDDPELDRAVNESFYAVEDDALPVAEGGEAELRFVFADGAGLRVEKAYTFHGGSYALDTDIRVLRDGQPVDEARIVWGPGLGNPSPEEMKKRFSASTGMAALAGGEIVRMDERKYKPEESAVNFIDWAAYEDNYFAALFTHPAPGGTAVFLRETADQGAYYLLEVSLPERAFIGPKSLDDLRSFGAQAKRIINFGFFGTVAEALLVAARWVHGLVPNWGLAIVILTVLIKILFFPLTYSSTKSMAKMQELQPKVKALRAKYKRAKQDIQQRRQMNEEMMRLYKEHGVNPAGGCLPLLIQLPVFWGFFRMLTVAVEFRKAPFLLWINDLSVADPFYVTPILMGATQFISQKMTPTSADPTQARMMLIMPVVMTIFFMNFQSGLVLYWLTNNVLQIGQQALMNRMRERRKRDDHAKRRTK